MKAFTGAVWAAYRFRALGYSNYEPSCPRCQTSLDTMCHRIPACPMGEHVCDRYKKTATRVLHFEPTGPWRFSRRPMPLCRWCPKAASLGRSDIVLARWIDQLTSDAAHKLSGGYAFCDGSASRHAVVELRRAAWAV